MRYRTLALCLALCLSLVVGVVVSHPAAALASPAAPHASDAQVRAPVPTLAWQSCGPGLEAFQCTTAKVPADYDQPSGRTLTIALTRLPAGGPAQQRLGTLFTNPGGPGGSGVDFVQQAARLVYSPAILERYDIVGFDPRGVARSDPATCFPTPADEQAFLSEGPPYPVTNDEERRFGDQVAQLAVRCQLTSPERFTVASTANVARDLDLLRQAVGDPLLTYAGYSYGT